ncbi:MAG: DUF4157 domain-containing protein [Stigonema ocellatum SAG 48.90 = DSM 106950]|nr:DUF4157 domain-containing protein [Stigonema ocellatum SAG 48.90 = DSM 106950]
MREWVGKGKKATTSSFSISTLSQPIRGFGLESSEVPQAVTGQQAVNKPRSHDLSRISMRPQAKLTVNQPGDVYEQEADRVAQQVMQRMSKPANHQSVQREEAPQEEEEQTLQTKSLANSITPLLQREEAPQEEEEQTLQTKSLANSITSVVQREEASEDQEEQTAQMKPMVQRQSSRGGMTATTDVETSIKQARGGGQPLAKDVRQPMEQAFGTDFSGVKVHTDSRSDQLNKSVQARAFTTGQDIFFRQGEYSPGSHSGKELLAHELTHVVQQNGSAVQAKSVSSLTPKENKVQTKAVPTKSSVKPSATPPKENSQTQTTPSSKSSTTSPKENPQKQTEADQHGQPENTDPKANAEKGKQQGETPPAKKGGLVAPPPADGGDAVTDPPPGDEGGAGADSGTSATKNGKKPEKQGDKQGQQKSTDSTADAGKGTGEGQAAGTEATKNGKNPEKQGDKQGQQKSTDSTADAGTGTGEGQDLAVDGGSVTGLPETQTEAATELPGTQTATLPGTTEAGNGKKAPASAEEDPEFQAVVNTTKEVAGKQKEHQPSEGKAQEAQAAAVPPGNEVDSKAQANQVGEMGQAETPGFDAAAFKAKLMERIADMAPKNLQEADDFKNNNKLDSVKGDLTGKVKEEQKSSQGQLEEKTKQKPDTSGIEPKQVTPLSQADPGAPPSDVGADKAAPKSKGQSEVEAPLQEDSKKLDQQMSQQNITEEQLTNSNEPEFQGAVTAKKDAQTNATQAPQQYRTREQNILSNAQATAEATAQQHLQGMHGIRTQHLNQVADQQVGGKGKDEQARAKVAGDINKIYEDTKGKVEKTLGDLDGQVQKAFDDGAGEAKQAFEDYVGKRMDAYKSDRYSGFWGPAKWLWDKLAGMPDEVNAFYQEGRQLYIEKMDGVINNVVTIISKGLTQAKAQIAEGKQQIQTYVTQLPQDLQGFGQETASGIESKFEALQQSVDDKQDELIDTLAQKYQENLKAVDDRIEEMKAENRGLIQKAFDFIVGVIKTIIELTKMLLEVLARVAGVVGQILKDPIGFLSNLIQAVKQGFLNFMKNIGQHLEQGLIGWLTGTMAETGIQMPESLDMKGIFSLAMQLLGFTYEAIRAQAVKRLGEEKVSHLEQNFEIFKTLASEGVAGLWQHIQEQIGDLKSLVLEPIKNFIITTVITAGIEWILSLLTPASAFIKACKAIYEIVKFFMERAQQIADLINAILDAIGAIASGAIDQAVKGVENALAKALPVVISFLASLLGLGGIAQKVQAIFQKLRRPMEKAVNWVIDKGAKIANKVGGKFKNSKVGKKVGAVTDSAKEKYKAGKQWAEDKKQAAEQWVNDKKEAANQKFEEKKNQLLDTKAGKKLTGAHEWTKNKVNALENKRQTFHNKVEAVKNWPAKKLEALENKAKELKGAAKDKFKQSKLGKKWEATKEWGSKKKEAAKDKYEKTTNKIGDKLGLGKDKEKGKEVKPEDRTRDVKGKDSKPKEEKQHILLAKQAVSELKKTDRKQKDYKTLRAEKQAQAKQIEKSYTQKLEKGIKLTVSFEDAAKDEKDGKLNFKVVIAPNDVEMVDVVESQEPQPDDLTQDQDHKDETAGASECDVNLDELNIKEFSQDDEGLKNVFFSLANRSGYPNLPIEAYNEWYNNGVFTRNGFLELLKKYSGGNNGGNQIPLQRARTGNTVSYQQTYNTSNFGQFTNITYTRDGLGNIEFSSPTSTGTWRNPVNTTTNVQLNQGLTDKQYGLMKNGRKILLKQGSRSQHFSIANRIKKIPDAGSPAGWTWHHKSNKYEMVLVDRVVHSKHGHNGGMHIW